MADKPIIFSGAMIQAILAGRKTQTRRVLKPQPEPHMTPDATLGGRVICRNVAHGLRQDIRVPYAPGDRLWVKEVLATWDGGHRDAVYRASLSDDEWQGLTHDAKAGAPWKIRSPIFMPRWASRLTLTVTEVRVQRLQEISGEDCIAEGVPCSTCAASWSVGRSACNDRGCFEIRQNFRTLWNSLHGDDAWDQNPWVNAISFTVERRNIDA